MKSREERREEERKYNADVYYEVWRSGGNPDRINDDRVEDSHYRGMFSDEAASRELRAQRPSPREEEQCEEQEEQP